MTIALYAQFLLNAVFFGFSMGVAPVISYNYGSQNVDQTRKIFKYCMIFVVGASILAFSISEILAPTIVALFAEKGSSVYELTLDGFALFSANFIFAGVNIFTSSMFTAFSNGKVSALISFMRTFVFITLSILILPEFFGVNGIWISTTVAEFLSIIMCIFYMNKYKKEYNLI
ncbi:MAG: MATE family efflux transporter [Clostridium sp.]